MKKTLLLALTSFSILYFTSSSSANAQEPVNQEEVSNVEQEFREIQQKYSIEEVDLSTIPEDHILNFNSAEDFEAFIKELQMVEDEEVISSNFEQKSLIQPINSGLISAAATKYYDDSAKMDLYSPFNGWGMGSLLQFKRINFDYKYYYHSTTGAKQFKKDSITNIKADIYGVSAWSWSQSSAKATTGGTTSKAYAEIEAEGFYILGVDINGFTIGAKLPGTIKRTYDLS